MLPGLAVCLTFYINYFCDLFFKIFLWFFFHKIFLVFLSLNFITFSFRFRVPLQCFSFQLWMHFAFLFCVNFSCSLLYFVSDCCNAIPFLSHDAPCIFSVDECLLFLIDSGLLEVTLETSFFSWLKVSVRSSAWSNAQKTEFLVK